MKYTSINELSTLNTHDARIESIDYQGKNMIWELSFIIADKTNSQNDTGFDMYIDNNVITFENYKIESIIFPGHQTRHLDGSIEKHEAVAAKPEEFDSIIKNTLKHGGETNCVYDCPSDEGYKAAGLFINGRGSDVYEIIINCSQAVVEWNEFTEKAFYEEDEWKEKYKQRIKPIDKYSEFVSRKEPKK
jgi:hypothetical protein